MFNFIDFGWGNGVGNLRKKSEEIATFTYISRCSILCLVDKTLGFYQSLSQLFHTFFLNLNPVFISINCLFLPTINSTYKDNNELNKLILLPGGCV